MKATTSKCKLVKMEIEPEDHSKAATTNLDHNPATISSELSELEDIIEVTPKLKKKKHCGNNEVVPADTSVSHTRHTSSNLNKDKCLGKDSATKVM